MFLETLQKKNLFQVRRKFFLREKTQLSKSPKFCRKNLFFAFKELESVNECFSVERYGRQRDPNPPPL